MSDQECWGIFSTRVMIEDGDDNLRPLDGLEDASSHCSNRTSRNRVGTASQRPRNYSPPNAASSCRYASCPLDLFDEDNGFAACSFNRLN